MNNTNKQKTHHEVLEEVLLHLLKNMENANGTYKDDCYSYVIKAITDKYSNTYVYPNDNNRRPLNAYFSCFNRKRRKDTLNTLIFSKYARESLEKAIKEGQTNFKSSNSNLHIEHLLPMSASKRDAFELKGEDLNLENIHKCFLNAQVIVITKYEAKYLDGSGEVITDDLINYFKQFNPSIEEVEKNKKLIGNRLKSHGTALLRFVHLMKRGVKFVDSTGKEIDNIVAYQMAESNRFEVGQFKIQ